MNILNKLFKRQPTFVITKGFKGAITESNLLQSSGIVIFSINRNSIDKDGIIWQISDDGFFFEFKIESRMFILSRNDDTLINPFDQIDNSSNLLIIINWTSTKMLISYAQKKGVKDVKSEMPTELYAPPLPLIRWARQKGLIQRRCYESEEHFRSTIHSCFETIQLKIDESGGYAQFWDFEYGRRKKVVNRNPKKETDIHPIIHCFLSDQSLLLSFDVIPEFKTGVGNVDFVLIGKLQTGESTKICVEFKNAHSPDIYKGLTVQLPAYMRNIKATYGIYGIFDYQGEWFENPKPLNDGENSLFVEISKCKIKSKEPMLKNISECYFKLSKQESASGRSE